ncbi:MAG TPA: PadR family transcriptional regulator [Terriglobales bacterium]|nr:PadR family transcriptional regulator [Terriglobales bacterium]
MGDNDLIPGTLEMLILRILALQPEHGFGIQQRIEQISGGVFVVNPGSLLPALRRIERSGWARSEWGETASHRKAKYYRLTASGRRRLGREQREWSQQAAAIAKILEARA